MRNERVFTGEIIKSFRELSVPAYKIPDMPRVPIIQDGKETGTRFIPQKPFDIVADIKDLFIGIECKFFKGNRTIKREYFQRKDNNQLDNLLKHNNCFIFLNLWKSRDFNKLIILDRDKIIYLNGWGVITSTELSEMEYVSGFRGQYDLTGFCRKILSLR
jgi:hypothetical protein